MSYLGIYQYRKEAPAYPPNVNLLAHLPICPSAHLFVCLPARLITESYLLVFTPRNKVDEKVSVPGSQLELEENIAPGSGTDHSSAVGHGLRLSCLARRDLALALVL